MRTENPSTPAPVIAQLRAQLARARRFALARGPATRWIAVLGVVAALGALGYMASSPSPGKYLRGGQQFPADEIAKITRELDGHRVEYRVDDRRISVPSDRLEEATGLVARLNVGPRSIPDIIKDSHVSSPWDSPTQAERRELRAREEILEAMIRNLDGILESYVKINRVRARGGLRPSSAATAFIWLDTEGDREVGDKTVHAIENIVIGNEPDLKPDAVTVIDKKGHRYRDPRDNSIAASSLSREREEKLGQEILEELEWIKGVRVTVQLVPAPAPAPAKTTPAQPADPTLPPGVDEPALPESRVVGVNQPLGLDPEPKPAGTDGGPVAAPEVVAAPVSAKPAAEAYVADVWVRVPRSYYYLKVPANRDPSPEEIQPFVSRTESLVRTAVKHVVPPGELRETAIDTIPDDVAARGPLVAPVVPETRRALSWWVAAAAGGAVMATLLVVGSLLIATRRPRMAPSPEVEHVRYPREAAEEPGPGPSERVRELIRRNPEAAASVLHRWIGQGGHVG